MSRPFSIASPCTAMIASLACLLISACNLDKQEEEEIDSHVVLTLLQETQIPSLEEISPYEEALIVNKYRLENVIEGQKPGSGEILIAQWAISNSKPVPDLPLPGDQRSMWITPFSNMPELNSVPMRNDQDFDPNELIYYDLTPLPASLGTPKVLRNDYRSDLSRRMPVYWLAFHQLKLVTIGNSHTAAAVNTKRFYEPDNYKVPVALNMSPAGSGITFQCLLADEYLSALPALEWVLWGVSPRIFNKNYAIDRRARMFENSPGYLYDRQHWNQLINKAPPVKPLTTHEIREAIGTSDRPWGWSKKENHKYAVPITHKDRKAILRKCRRNRFDWSQDAWEQFRHSVEKLAEKNIRILLFIPPYHPLVAGTRVVDGDGTGKAEYEKVVSNLKQLAKSRDNVFILDAHQGGHHEFKHEHFADIDHLHTSGAEILTSRLIDFINSTPSPSP